MNIENLGKLSLEQKLASVKKDKVLQALVAKYLKDQDQSGPEPENVKLHIEEKDSTTGKGRPKKYDTEEERKSKKREQTLASNKKKRQERKSQIEGEGVLDGVKSVARAIGTTAKKGVKAVQKVAQSAQKFATAVVEGRDDYPPKVRQILSKNGDAVITKWTVKRAPVPSVLTSALSGLSWGQFGKNQKDAGFDTLFHLFIELESVNGRRFLVEKNEVINMEMDLAERPNTESRIVPNPPQGLTLAEIMDATRERQGGKYFKYSARDNNCQDFILALLQANGAGDAETFAFVKQDTKKLYDNLSGLRKISNTLTDLGGRANVVMSGVGMPKGKGDLIHIDLGSHNGKNYKMGEGIESDDEEEEEEDEYKVQSIVFLKSHWTLKDARKYLREHSYKVPKVDAKENTFRFRQISPATLKKNGFTRYRTDTLGDSGVELVIAYTDKNKISGKSIMKGKGFEGTDSERDMHRKFMGSGVHIHNHYHFGGAQESDSESESDSDEEPQMKGGKLSKTSKAIIKGLKTVAHYAIPSATSALGAMAGEVIAPELGPVSGVAGSAMGAYAGNQINKKLGIGFGLMGDGFPKGSAEALAWGKKMHEARKAKGSDLKKGGFKKGSEEARAHMARIRAMRKSKAQKAQEPEEEISGHGFGLMGDGFPKGSAEALAWGKKMHEARKAKGTDLKKGGFKKGSQEAKDHMARIRALRKSKK